LNEISGSPEFLERLHREFPEGASEWPESLGVSRRDFLSLMGESMALAGAVGCRPSEPQEAIVPYVTQPEGVVPGIPLQYATSLNLFGYAHGMLVTSREGRPIKIEGNPLHPASLGATNVFMQAAILDLYDPDRSQLILRSGKDVSTWDRFLSEVRPLLDARQRAGGRGLRILSEPVVSPTLASQASALKRKYPEARWHQWTPAARDNVSNGARQAFGEPLNIVYRFDRAKVILSLDSDFLTDEPGSLQYARHFIDRRRVRADNRRMNRLYVIESSRSITGATADHRWPVAPDQIAAIAESLLRGAPAPEWLKPVMDDLRSAGNGALVIPGPYQPPHVHATCHAINAQLGAIGNTVLFTDPIDAEPVDSMQSLVELVRDMQAGQVDLLFILGCNPIYSAPADLEFAAAMEKVPMRVHLGLHADETAAECHWHLPMSHELEAWGDGRAFDGTLSIGQPLISPLYLLTRSTIEFVASALLGESVTSGYELVRARWLRQFSGRESEFESWWRQALHDGVIAGSALPTRSATPQAAQASTAPTTEPSDRANPMRIVFRPDACVWDGRFANNGWLQELPKPITKLTWDNAALMSPATAHRVGVERGSTVDLLLDGRTLRGVPACVVPGHPDDCVTLHLGYGRTRAGRVGSRRGFNAYALRGSTAPWFSAGLELRHADASYLLAITQEHHLMHGRDLVRVRDINGADHGHDAHGPRKVKLDLYPEVNYKRGNQWGMVIDLNACIGCNACVIACQSENNIPVVGKDQVSRGREMHWLRIDTYFASHDAHGEHPAANPETYFQPVPCMHCEQAPCEVVCPVGATVHDSEGTNNMVYNRCIGTRYCSNNCPYKVRRFNYLEFNGDVSATERLMKNPEVTVRSRGVMEKCTYCIQRIDAARIEAKKRNREYGFVLDGEVTTACQQSCPTRAISFGNLNDQAAQVTKLRNEPTNYGLLEELNTNPRTTYLERFRNSNAAVASQT
jgi:molybdopterin-containing oxidoreductase family iron-sulfur binding subunit